MNSEPGLIELCEQLVNMGVRMEVETIAAKTKPCDLCATDELGTCYWHDPHPMTRRQRSLEMRYAVAMGRIRPIDPTDEAVEGGAGVAVNQNDEE